MSNNPTKWIAWIAIGCLSACSTITAPEFPELISFSPSNPEATAYRSLKRNTSSQKVSADQMLIDAWGAPRTSLELVELRLLSRAGDEAYRAGYDRFFIRHIRDRNLPLAGGIFGASLLGGDLVWIGSYEELIVSRYERDQAFAVRAWVNPGLTALVEFVGPSHSRYEKAFKALEVYDILNREHLP